ncbi:DUF5343 domain-containing protein [Candidatus Poriferisocius sp.]|uniref:DUF5343 domain-containing protein n=1 Tax=Candidatus Poriferisocius sp. TaxID=3101276 RepID=UPI003B5B7BF6
MAEAKARNTYPKLPAKNWWTLRERFINSMPNKVDADYLQSVLGLSTPASAANLIGPLRAIGLIDDEGAPTARALEWRDDSTYPSVCEAIIADVYPDTLPSAFPNPATDAQGVSGWFSRNTGAGRSASTAMAAFYALLADADPEGRTANSNGATKKQGKKADSARTKGPATRGNAASKNDAGSRVQRTDPEVNINLQIHIDSSASAEQINQIFKSMAKHLYGGG